MALFIVGILTDYNQKNQIKNTHESVLATTVPWMKLPLSLYATRPHEQTHGLLSLYCRFICSAKSYCRLSCPDSGIVPSELSTDTQIRNTIILIRLSGNRRL